MATRLPWQWEHRYIYYRLINSLILNPLEIEVLAGSKNAAAAWLDYRPQQELVLQSWVGDDLVNLYMNDDPV